AIWFAAAHFRVLETTGGSRSTFVASFALLFGPFWAFGFGAAEPIRHALRARWARMLAPGLLVSSYLVFSLPRGEFEWRYCAALSGIPVVVALLLEFFAHQESGGVTLQWPDLVALVLVGVPIVMRWLHGSYPHPALSAMPKLLLADAALYGFLVVRRLEDVGYDFRPRGRDLAIGLRELVFFAPFGIGLGFALHFIGFHRVTPSLWEFLAGWITTFILIAIPEELFFRGILLNLLERRLGPRAALLASAVVFGFSHFNKRAAFNWRYILLATIAGIFYGRAWRDRRRLFSSGITHATVDVIWGTWFK
ncbi:MAG TPA: CPBP family intramembrane glutamic endopeptidase, partial [Terriglobales bacterium]|nr:CPBP family intramembrane glutamic endopeptidase [Terriglobales bacterium]